MDEAHRIGEVPVPPHKIVSPLVNNDFWDRMERVEALLAEAREILEDLKEGEA